MLLRLFALSCMLFGLCAPAGGAGAAATAFAGALAAAPSSTASSAVPAPRMETLGGEQPMRLQLSLIHI